MILGSMMRFPLGRLVITPAVLQSIPEDEICRALDRHILGQWGDLSDHDRAANELALSTASRLLSVYHTNTGTELRVMTTGNRFATTVFCRMTPPLKNRTPMNTNENGSPFGDVIYTYTRAHAVADGFQVEVTKTAQEAGIRFPVFLTRAVYDVYVTVPPGVTGQDEAGRLWDLVWMLRFAIHRARPGVQRIPVAFYVRNDNRAARLVKLIATCGPLDIDDPQPAITIMQPGED